MKIPGSQLVNWVVFHQRTVAKNAVLAFILLSHESSLRKMVIFFEPFSDRVQHGSFFLGKIHGFSILQVLVERR